MFLLGSFFKPSLGLKQSRRNKHRGGDRGKHCIPWQPNKSWSSFPSIFKLGHLHVKDLTQLLSSAHVTTVYSKALSYCSPIMSYTLSRGYQHYLQIDQYFGKGWNRFLGLLWSHWSPVPLPHPHHRALPCRFFGWFHHCLRGSTTDLQELPS